MVEQERRYVDQIRQDLASSNSTKLQLELDSAVKRLAKLEQQLDDLKAGKVRFEMGLNYTLQILCIFFLCEEAKKILNSLQKKRRNVKENFTYKIT